LNACRPAGNQVDREVISNVKAILGALVIGIVGVGAPARAADFWAGAAGGVGVGDATTVGGIVEVGTQDDYFGFSADVHLSYDAITAKQTYQAFANLRLQIPVVFHPYGIVGIGAGNDVPMYTNSIQALWKAGVGVRIAPISVLFIDAQVGTVSAKSEYLEIAIGLSI
jgi:hypothetical protein